MRKTINIDPRIQMNVDKLSSIINEPVIIRVNSFDEKALTQFEEDMDDALSSGQDVVPIVIDSFGGGAYAVLGMIAAVEACPKPVATILSSKAMSAGACLFSFGTEGYRFMHPEAHLMIHDVGSLTAGKVEEIKVDAQHLEILNHRMYERISRHIGQSGDFLLKLVKDKHHHCDWFLTAKEAKKLNIANHLTIPRYEVNLKLETKFTFK